MIIEFHPLWTSANTSGEGRGNNFAYRMSKESSRKKWKLLKGTVPQSHETSTEAFIISLFHLCPCFLCFSKVSYFSSRKFTDIFECFVPGWCPLHQWSGLHRWQWQRRISSTLAKPQKPLHISKRHWRQWWHAWETLCRCRPKLSLHHPWQWQ
jgi:hypothetical protein